MVWTNFRFRVQLIDYNSSLAASGARPEPVDDIDTDEGIDESLEAWRLARFDSECSRLSARVLLLQLMEELERTYLLAALLLRLEFSMKFLWFSSAAPTNFGLGGNSGGLPPFLGGATTAATGVEDTGLTSFPSDNFPELGATIGAEIGCSCSCCCCCGCCCCCCCYRGGSRRCCCCCCCCCYLPRRPSHPRRRWLWGMPSWQTTAPTTRREYRWIVFGGTTRVTRTATTWLVLCVLCLLCAPVQRW